MSGARQWRVIPRLRCTYDEVVWVRVNSWLTRTCLNGYSGFYRETARLGTIHPEYYMIIFTYRLLIDAGNAFQQQLA